MTSALSLNSLYISLNLENEAKVNNLAAPSNSSSWIPNDEISIEIFSYLGSAALRTCCLVSTAWQAHVSTRYMQDILKERMYHELRAKRVIFGPEDWKADAIDHPDARKFLDPKTYKLLKSPCLFFPNKRREETHMLLWYPGTLNGKDTTFITLGAYCGPALNPYVSPEVITEHGNTVTGPGRWLLILLQIAPESRKKSFDEQLEYLSTCPDYRLIKLGETVALVSTRYESTGEILLSDSPTRTEERCGDRQIAVGCARGLSVYSCENNSTIPGVIAVLPCGSAPAADA